MINVTAGINVIKIAPADAKKENLVPEGINVIALAVKKIAIVVRMAVLAATAQNVHQNVIVTNKNVNLKNAKKDVRLKNRFI